MEVAGQGVRLYLVQPESLSVRDDLVLEEGICTISGTVSVATAQESWRVHGGAWHGELDFGNGLAPSLRPSAFRDQENQKLVSDFVI